ncbi:hypothetical protein ACF0H5_016212 [Mactra antiquata]
MAYNFAGKKIFVTGATRGIGRGLVNSLLKCQAEVYGLGSNKNLLDKLVAECPDVKPVHVDLGDWDLTRAELVNLPAMNGIVNNAACGTGSVSALDLSRSNLEKSLNVNLFGPINVIQALGKKMVDAGNGGSIVNVSSVVGINPMRDMMAYNISKAGLDMVTKQFALELGQHNIRVNSVNLSLVLTDRGKDFDAESTILTNLRSQTPLGRFVDLTEAINPMLYLLSDYSSMVTGTLQLVDGGLLSNIHV